MSKFSLRKVLAVGAAAALGVTGFVGIAPANAATLSTAAATLTYTGTGTKIVEGTDFDVSLTKSSTHAYWSETAEGVYGYTSAVVYRYVYQDWLDYDPGGTWSGSERIVYSTSTIPVATPGDATPTGEYVRSVTTVSTATSIVWEATGSGTTSGTTSATLSHPAVTADTDVTYTAFIDTDPIGVDAANGTRDTWEAQGPALTLTFADYVEANWVTEVQTYQETEDSADVEATLTPAGTGWNMTQMDDDIWMQFFKNGAAQEAEASSINVTDTEPGSLLYDMEVEPNGVYTARAYRDATGGAATTSPLGATSAAKTVEYLYGDTRIDDIEIDRQVGPNITTNDIVRSGVKDITVPVTIVDVNDNPVAVAGQRVEVYAYPSVDMTINGVAVKAGATYGPVFLTTNASGKLSIPVTNPTAKDGEQVEFYVYTYGQPTNSDPDPSYDGYVEDSTTYVWEDAYVFGFQEAHQVGAGQINVTKGQSYTLNWTVHDQFGELLKDDLRVNVSIDGGTNIPVAVNNGKASYTVTEAYNAPDYYEVVAELYSRDAAPSNNYTSENFYTFLGVHVVANNSVGNLNAVVRDEDDDLSTDSDFDVDVMYDDFGTHNFYLDYNTFFDGMYIGDYDTVSIEGVVTNSAGIVLPGAKVDVKGAGQFWTPSNGLLISDLNFGIYSENSITVYADENGYYEVYFASHKAGNNTVTATSGGKSASTTFLVDSPNENNADDFQIAAPKSIKAGRTFTATVTVVDEYGNVVKAENVDDTYMSAFSNRGLLVVSSPVGEDEGRAIYQVKVMLQPLDRGPVVVNLDWIEEDDDVRVMGSFAVWAGPAVNATAGAKKGRVIVEAYRAVGQTVNVFVGKTKVASFVPNKANDRFVVKGIKSGNRKVSVKVTPGYDFAGVISVK